VAENRVIKLSRLIRTFQGRIRRGGVLVDHERVPENERSAFAIIAAAEESSQTCSETRTTVGLAYSSRQRSLRYRFSLLARTRCRRNDERNN